MIALIGYNEGDTAMVADVFDELNLEYIVTKRESDLLNASKIIFAGVGEASSAVKNLHLTNLFTMLRVTKKPMLGIGLGMQLFCDKSKEGNTACLGIFSFTTEKFDEAKVKVPNTGWNQIKIVKQSKLFYEIPEEESFFFANSYYVPVNEKTTSICNYGVDFSSSMEKENVYGVQFHPEKSGKVGIQLIKNFVEKC